MVFCCENNHILLNFQSKWCPVHITSWAWNFSTRKHFFGGEMSTTSMVAFTDSFFLRSSKSCLTWATVRLLINISFPGNTTHRFFSLCTLSKAILLSKCFKNHLSLHFIYSPEWRHTGWTTDVPSSTLHLFHRNLVLSSTRCLNLVTRSPIVSCQTTHPSWGYLWKNVKMVWGTHHWPCRILVRYKIVILLFF